MADTVLKWVLEASKQENSEAKIGHPSTGRIAYTQPLASKVQTWLATLIASLSASFRSGYKESGSPGKFVKQMQAKHPGQRAGSPSTDSTSLPENAESVVVMRDIRRARQGNTIIFGLRGSNALRMSVLLPVQ